MKKSKLDQAIHVWLLFLRLFMGWLFFYAGLDKLMQGDWGGAGFLSHLSGTFAPFFASLAGNPLVDWLNMIGLFAIGLALILGVFVRWASFWGIILMLLYYLAAFPPRADYYTIVDDHLIYAIVLLGFIIFGAGQLFGLDNAIEKSRFYRRNKHWLKWVLG